MSLFLVVAAGLALGCPARPEQAIEPIKLGVLNPISGPLSALGASWEDAARLAAEGVNAGGGVFDGRPLELVFADTATNPDEAVAAAKKLKADGVIGFVGPATSGESARVLAEVAEPSELPMISCCATAASLTGGNAPNQGFFFRTTPSDVLQGQALAFLAREGYAAANLDPCPTVAFIHRGDEYGVGFQGVFVDAYDGEPVQGSPTPGRIVAEGAYGETAEATLEELQAAGTSLASAIDDALETGPNPDLCIVVISFDQDGGSVIQAIDDELTARIAARTAGDPTFSLTYHYLAGDGANSSAFASIVEDVGAKVIGTVPFHATNEAYAQFTKAFQARYETADEPIAFTAQNYDAVVLMALAVTRARSTTGKEVRNALFPVSGDGAGQRFEGAFFGEIAAAILAGDDVDYVGPSGEVTFDAFGDVIGDYVTWTVQPSANGFSVVEIAPLLASDFAP